MRLEERERVERGRERRGRPVRGHLPVPRVGEELRLDRDRRLLVARRDVEALDLHVAQHLQPVAAVGGEQRVVDLAALVAELAVEQVVGEDEVGLAAPSRAVGRQRSSSSRRRSSRGHEQERVVLHRAGEPRVERVALEVRVAWRARRASARGPNPSPPPPFSRRSLGKTQWNR